MSTPEPTIRQIQHLVRQEFGLSEHVFLHDPSRSVARVRQIAMWLAFKLTTKSLYALGREFERHHTTVLGNIRRIDDFVFDAKEPGAIALKLLDRLERADA